MRLSILVGATKSVSGGSHYMFVDGGMADNPSDDVSPEYTFDMN